MRLRDQTSEELDAVAVLRARLRETHGPEADDAPFLRDWETKRLPCGRLGLHGLCWGHPELGDVIMTTSAIIELGDGYARTESCGRLYVLGHECREHRLRRALSGRRGPLGMGLPAGDATPEPRFRP